jgi:hypothetical protein
MRPVRMAHNTPHDASRKYTVKAANMAVSMDAPKVPRLSAFSSAFISGLSPTLTRNTPIRAATMPPVATIIGNHHAVSSLTTRPAVTATVASVIVAMIEST